MQLVIKHLEPDSPPPPSPSGKVKIALDAASSNVALRLVQSSNLARSLESSVEELREKLLQLMTGAKPFVPHFRVREKSGALLVSAELPELDERSVEVRFEGKLLKISGARTKHREVLRRRFQRTEKTLRSFERTIPIHGTFDPESAVATLNGDVLRINVPALSTARAAEQAEAREFAESSRIPRAAE